MLHRFRVCLAVRARLFGAMFERDGAGSEVGNMEIGSTTASLSRSPVAVCEIFMVVSHLLGSFA